MITTINGVMYERAAEKEGLTCWLSLAFIADYEASVLPQAIRRFGDYALKELADYIENPLQYHITNGYTAKSGADYTDKYGNPVAPAVRILITDQYLRPWPHRNLAKPTILNKGRGSAAQAGELLLDSAKAESRPVVDRAPVVPLSRATEYPIFGLANDGKTMWREDSPNNCIFLHARSVSAEPDRGATGGRGFAEYINDFRTTHKGKLVSRATAYDWLAKQDLREFYEESCQPAVQKPWKTHGARVRFTAKAIMDEGHRREGEEGTIERCNRQGPYGPLNFRVVGDDPDKPYAIHDFSDSDMAPGGPCEGWLEPVWPEPKVTPQSSKEKDVEARMVGARVFMSKYGVNVWLPEFSREAATIYKGNSGWQRSGGATLNMMGRGDNDAKEVFGETAAKYLAEIRNHLIITS